VFVRSGTTWTQQAGPLIGTGASGLAYQGNSVSLTNNGNMLCFGGYEDNSGAGAVWIFQRNSSGIWSQLGSKIPNPNPGSINYFGNTVSFNGDGSLLAISTYSTSPNIGIGYIYENVSNVYQLYQNIAAKDTTNVGSSEYGNSISIDQSGLTLVIGSSSDNNYFGSSQIFTKCY
jgi:hypothetical protein